MLRVIFGLMVSFFVLVPELAAQSNACVRNFAVHGFNPCESGLTMFAAVVARDDPEALVCTRVYDDEHCKESKEQFTHAMRSDETVVCVLNFNQAVTGNYCAMYPDDYEYVADPYE